MPQALEFKPEILTDECIYVHCDTKDKAINLLTWASNNDKKWNGTGEPMNEDTYWSIYKDNTVYSISTGMFGDTPNVHGYGYEPAILLTYEEALLIQQKPIKRKLKQY